MTKEPIRVEIVTPVHNRKAITLQCLKSLSRLDSGGLDIGIVIVDDGSTDGTGEEIRTEFPNAEVIDGNGDLWFTEGTNVGIRSALRRDPKYILMINDDQVFDACSLRYLVETAERQPRSIVGPLLLLWDTPHKLFQTSPIWDTWAGGWRHWYSQTVWTVPDRPWKVDLIVGNCVLVPAEAIRECGLMNSQRYPNFGDAEYTPRLRKAGWNLIVDPRSRIFCQPNAVMPSIRSKSIGKRFEELFVDLKSPKNLRRRLYSYIDGGPSKMHGLAAFLVFLARVVTNTTWERQSWGQTLVEEPLRKTFAAATLDDR